MTRPKHKLCPECGKIIPTEPVYISDARDSDTRFKIGNHGRAGLTGCNVLEKKCAGSGKQYLMSP
jgi:hypothetical protein